VINAQWPSKPLAPARGGITELVLTQNAPDQFQLLLPMVAHLSRSCPDRWLTWVNPGPIDRHELERYGVDTTRVRLIHTHKPQDVRWIAWEALTKGNSHTVIAAPGKLTKREVQLLESAAQRGECQGVLLRLR
jgi:cell division inhibitor SulA